MIEYPIKTYSCAVCPYVQDFEPTQQLVDLHFNRDPYFGLTDIQAGECPACALKGIRGVKVSKETNPLKKIIVRHMEQVDVDVIENQLLGEDTREVFAGDEYREETLDEKRQRLKDSIKKRGALDPEADQAVDEIINVVPTITRKFATSRPETAVEKMIRVEKTLASMQVLSTEEINAFRARYEDV